MSFITHSISECSRYLRPHISYISMAIVATLLVIYGEGINRFIRGHIKKIHFLFRITIFVALCSAGYAAASIWLSKIIARYLYALDNTLLAPGVLLIFIGIGVLAERRNHI